VQAVLGYTFERAAAHKIEIGLRHHPDEEDRFQQDDGYRMTGGRMVLTRAGAPGSQTNQVVGARALAAFVADTITWRGWSVSPGIRYEAIDLRRVDYARTDPARTGPTTVIDTSVSVVVPGIGASYTVRPGLAMFGGVHKGFAPPGPGLAAETRAEESLNYELGARAEWKGVSAEATGFFNDYANLLGRDTLSSGGTGDGALFNGGKVRVHGLETSALWSVPVIAGRLALPIRIAYTFTGTEFRNSFQSQYGPWGHVQVGDELPYVPRHQFHASADVERSTWRARLTATAVGRMRTMAGQGAYLASESTEASVVVGLSGEYTLTAGARLVASVQNLADRTSIVARHPAGVRPGLPRLVTVGLKIDLERE
jgi:Fe(3+) dicitrate transport protein